MKWKKWVNAALGTALLTSVALAGCSSSEGSGNTSSAGGGEKSSEGYGNIALYSPETPDMTKEIGLSFEKAFSGSTVNVQYGGTNVIVNRLIAEKDNPMGDVWYGGGGFLPFESAKILILLVLGINDKKY